MGKLILVRHGVTDKNSSRFVHSFNDPESLNYIGKDQMRKTAKKLKEFSPFIIYSSKENRALESAEILSKSLKIPLKQVNGLHERNWGIFMGKPWEEIRKVLDQMTLKERYNYVAPKGESWKEFEERLIKAINKITKSNNNKTVVIVTHGGSIRALMPYLLKIPKEESFKYDLDNASITILSHENNDYKLVEVNNTTHLENT